MSKRHGILIIVLGVIVGLGPSIVGIIFPAYEAVTQSIVLLLLGFGSISMGIYHVRTTKVQGKRIRWWRHFPVVSGLFWVCMGVVVLIHALFPVLILSLLIVGFFIYSLILLFKDVSKTVKDE
jgi:uncharacterized membrane protein HdeD (DUF308 family)